MVIDEKGLVARMLDAYRKKSTGYKVACRFTERKVRELVISAPGWVAVMEREHAPRKVLALIVEHLGDVPTAGQAFQVQDKQTQTEIYDMAVPELYLSFDDKAKIARTQLAYQGHRVWQRTDNLNVHLISEKMEALLANYHMPLDISEDGLFYTVGKVSRVYISRVPVMRNEDTALDHLAKRKWV